MEFINLENGDFIIKINFIINQKTFFSELFKRFPDNKVWDINNGYKWLYFNNLKITEENLDVSICFKNEKMFIIHFSFSNPKPQNSSEWSAENELEQKNIYDNWLTLKFGSKRKFQWGKIGVIYDPRSCGTYMFLKYNKELN